MYKTALVLGLGVSGEAAVRLLLGEGTHVTAVDCCDDNEITNRAKRLKKKGVIAILGTSDLPKGNFDVCVVSPGIPADSACVKTVESRGIEIISELELGSSLCECPLLAITGSNGKSTFAKLCGDAMTLAGRRVTLAGNSRSPFCEVAANSSNLDLVVLEVSSFQLERVKNFRPRVGVLLNVQPDHLDRHGDMEIYTEIKTRLFRRMRNNDIGIVLDEHLKMMKELSGGRNKWVTFGLSKQADYRYENDNVHFKPACRSGTGRDSDLWRTMSLKGTIFANEIMGSMAAAAIAAIEACGVDSLAVKDAISSFEPLPHRMQEIMRINGVKFVNDSKATNLAALSAALKMSGEGIRLIAGGLLKEKNLKLVKKLLAKNVRAVYLIGNAAEEMDTAWRNVIQCYPCMDLEKAVRKAWHEARPGETILLSPGCASFDQFKNFEDRGEQFVEIVQSINRCCSKRYFRTAVPGSAFTVHGFGLSRSAEAEKTIRK